MIDRLHTGLAAIVVSLTLWPAPASAQSPFGVAPLPDSILAMMRGAFRPKTAEFLTMQNDFARSDARLIGSVGSIAMDVWWANDGTLLIAASVAAQR